MIKMQAIGRLGKDAEVKTVGDKKVINFSIAVDTGYGDNKKTLWVECGKWGDNTKVAEYLVKGGQVHVEGEPSMRQWESNGKSGVSLQLRVTDLTLVGGKSEGGQQSAPATQQQAAPATTSAPPPVDDSLPF